jgi:glycerol-3-phosphate dehydrogenase
MDTAGRNHGHYHRRSLGAFALAEEFDLLLKIAGSYLHKVPTRADILSVFVGIPPLVGDSGGEHGATVARDHTIRIDNSGMLSIAGPEWTTYRRKAGACDNRRVCG